MTEFLSRLSCVQSCAHCARYRACITAAGACACARTQACRARGPHSVVLVGLVCGLRQKNTLSQHHPWKPCRDRNVPTLGKLCRDTRRPFSRPKPDPSPNPVATQNFCRDTGLKNLCRDRESLCRDPNRHVGLGTMSRHEGLCRDTEPKSSVASAMSLHCHTRISFAVACASRRRAHARCACPGRVERLA